MKEHEISNFALLVSILLQPNQLTVISEPDFVYSFEYGDHVYFILREIAVEVLNIEVNLVIL